MYNIRYVSCLRLAVVCGPRFIDFRKMYSTSGWSKNNVLYTLICMTCHRLGIRIPPTESLWH